MSALPDWIKITGRFRTPGKLPEMPELNDFAYFDQTQGRPDGSDGFIGELRVRLKEIEFPEVIEALKKYSVPIVSCPLDVTFRDDFWDRIPDECIAATIQPDGYVSLPGSVDKTRVTPLTDPLYTDGRPDNDIGIGGAKPLLIEAGGIPIVSNRLLATLRQLGAEGETSEIIYRGNNKKAYDTVQNGFQRLLIQPEFEMQELEIDILPSSVPDDFGFCSLKRNYLERSWYEIAMSLERATELRSLQRNILLDPLFQPNGSLHQWLQDLNTNVASLAPE